MMSRMIEKQNDQPLVKEIEAYLRKITRQIINIDTEEESIQYLIDSFISKINSDFVGVILVENNELYPKAWGGEVEKFSNVFPLQLNESTERFLNQSLKDEDAYTFGDCAITKILKNSEVKTWFTVPLIDGEMEYGFCIVGYYTKVPLYEMYHVFDEFGKDIAVVISMVRRRERSMKRFEDTEWIKKFSIDKTLEENVKEFTSLASKGLNAQAACFYLLDETNDYFRLIYPVYGEVEFVEQIKVSENNELKDYFPYLEAIGKRQLTMPIVIDLKTVGVLHIERSEDTPAFSLSDRRMLRLLADYIAVLQENRQLYINEKEQRERLQLLLDYQQELVKQTVVDDDFIGITKILSEIFDCTVLLLDRFSHPISAHIIEADKEVLSLIDIEEKRQSILEELGRLGYVYSSWPITGVNSRLGYLVLGIEQITFDEFDLLAVNVARNISSIQFIKQKLVFDANEQAKESMMTKLLVDEIEDKQSIVQYANLFQWDIFQAHRVTSLTIDLTMEEKGLSLLEINMKKQHVWDHIMEQIVNLYSGTLTATYEENFLLIVPELELEMDSKRFWANFYNDIKKAAENSKVPCEVYVGIGNTATDIKEYNISYAQSIQALNVVKNRFQAEGYALFENLGSYTILHQLSHPVVDVFTKNQLGLLINYSEENDINLVETLKVYLQNNGNAKSTAAEMYMHRSSLIYRLERIEALLQIDLNDFETRFDLMMALKLLDMKDQSKGQSN